MINTKLILLFLITVALSINMPAQSKPPTDGESEPEIVEFCELVRNKTDFVGRRIRTEATIEYRITMEFVIVSKCDEKNVSIALGVVDHLMDRTIDVLTAEMNVRRTHTLPVKLIGTLQTSDSKNKGFVGGFGHNNWSRFQFEIDSPIVLESIP